MSSGKSAHGSRGLFFPAVGAGVETKEAVKHRRHSDQHFATTNTLQAHEDQIANHHPNEAKNNTNAHIVRHGGNRDDDAAGSETRHLGNFDASKHGQSRTLGRIYPG
ncbi:hypothetical protein [Prosthecobacter sp.]